MCVDEIEEMTSLEIYNTVWPHDDVTIDVVHTFKESAVDYVDYLVRDGGDIVGSGVGAILGNRAHRCISLIAVLPAKRNRGAGAALYKALSAWARERGAREMEARVADGDAESLSFARHRDFIEERRQVSRVLNLVGMSPFNVNPPDGIEIVTWALRPDLARGMYMVDVETRTDIPGSRDVIAEPFDEWIEHFMKRRTDSPEATFIALAEGEVVGFAKLSLTAPASAGNSMTAVKRTWRGRGIAGALKETEINWALLNGYAELRTSNEERNIPINRLNERLGYQPRETTIYLVGPLLSDAQLQG